MKPIRLVVMRLGDMHKVHPEQVTMDCALCGEKVGVYPSGQKALRLSPGPVEIVCQVCAAKEVDRKLDLQEIRDSKDVGKA